MIELTLDEPLRACILACETECVAECCGLDAFDFGDVNVHAWAVGRTRDEVAAARALLARCIALVETAAVSSSELNTSTGEYGGSRRAFLGALFTLERSLERES